MHREPLSLLFLKSFLPFRGDAIVAAAAFSFTFDPERLDVPVALHAVQQGIERPCRPLDLAIGELANMVYNLVAVDIAPAKEGQYNGLQASLSLK